MNRSSFGSDDLSTLLLRLYRLSQEVPIAEFHGMALRLLQEALPFDSSMWGSATSTPQGIDIHTIHLHNQPQEMLSAYEELKHLDTAGQAAACQPRRPLGFNVQDWFSRAEQAPLRDYGKRFEQANFFIISDFDPATQLAHWITLFRADDDARCTAGESHVLGLLAPHMMQALTLNRLAHLDRLETPGAAGQGSAICDPRGAIHHADASFEALAKAQWPGWTGRRLPDAVLACFLSGGAMYRGQIAVVTLRREQDLLFLRARPRSRVDDLTAKEREVAELAARGSTYKQIAQILQRSPSTVRNQIRSIYDKLQITNIAGLIGALRAAG